MNTVFITGATGFLGVNIIRQLIELNVTIHALKRQTSDTSELANLPIHWHIGDVTHLDSLLSACPENVDAFFHVAADTSMWKLKNSQQNQINLTGTQNAVTCALQKKAARFIHTSSIAAYGAHSDVITEATTKTGEQSFSNYYRTKHLSELHVLEAVTKQQLDAVVLNPCHIVGAPDHHNWSQMIQLVAKNKLPGVPPGIGSFCDIKEVARAHIRAAQVGKTGENYLLSGAELSFVEFIALIGDIVHQSTPNKATPASVLKFIGKLSELWSMLSKKEPDITPEKAFIVCDKMRVSSQKAQQELGYQADVDIRQALLDCVQWMKHHKQL